MGDGLVAHASNNLRAGKRRSTKTDPIYFQSLGLQRADSIADSKDGAKYRISRAFFHWPG